MLTYSLCTLNLNQSWVIGVTPFCETAQNDHAVVCIVLLKNNRNVKENSAVTPLEVTYNGHPCYYLKVKQIFTKKKRMVQHPCSRSSLAYTCLWPVLLEGKVKVNKNEKMIQCQFFFQNRMVILTYVFCYLKTMLISIKNQRKIWWSILFQAGFNDCKFDVYRVICKQC